MKKYRQAPSHFYILVIAAVFLLFPGGCASFSTPPARISVRVPSTTSLSPEEIRSFLPPDSKTVGRDSGNLEIVVTRYSPGIRRLSYAGDSITEKFDRAYIHTLVTFRRDNRVEKVYFIEARGRSREELLRNLARKISPLAKK